MHTSSSLPAPRTIAVTGATGLIGGHLVAQLHAQGYTVRTLSRLPWNAPPGTLQLHGDIREPAILLSLQQDCHAVIHLAGVAHTTLDTAAAEQQAESINVQGAANLLAAARRLGVPRVVLVSSAHVYAGQTGTNLREDAPTAADSFYARTKLLVERLALNPNPAASADPTEIIIARPCLTYGPGARFNLHALLRAIQRGLYFHCRGHNPLRSFLSVDNAAAALIHLLDHGTDRRIYNLTDPTPQPLDTFTDQLADQLGVRPPRTLPLLPLRAAATLAAPLRRLGLRSPLTPESLRKLTTPFSLDISALADTGFTWRGDEHATMHRMVQAFLHNPQY